jgi:hypothetical protein
MIWVYSLQSIQAWRCYFFYHTPVDCSYWFSTYSSPYFMIYFSKVCDESSVIIVNVLFTSILYNFLITDRSCIFLTYIGINISYNNLLPVIRLPLIAKVPFKNDSLYSSYLVSYFISCFIVCFGLCFASCSVLVVLISVYMLIMMSLRVSLN